MRFIAILTSAILAGCATQQPQLLPVEVKVPVAVSCMKPEQIPVRPDYESPGDNDQTPDGTIILHVARDWAKSWVYQQQLEAILDACR